jgi:hypothetical protein
MDPTALASLLKDYGPWGLLALALLTIRFLFNGWRDCMTARIDERGASATALERQAASNTAVAATLDDVREGQIEIAKLTAEALKRAEGSDALTSSHISDIRALLNAAHQRGS